MAEKVNPQRELMCCLECGRETTSINGVCYRCGGRGPNATHTSERKGRPEKSPMANYGDIEEYNEADEEKEN